MRGAKVVMRCIAVYKQGVGAEDFVGQLRLADELIKADSEELGLRVEWRSALLCSGVVLRMCGKGNLSGASLGGAVVFARDAFGEKREWLRLFDKGLEFVEERGAFRSIGNEDDAGLGAELAGAQRERSEEALGECGGAFAECAGKDEDRVAAGHLSEAGDGIGTGGGEIHEGAAGAE